MPTIFLANDIGANLGKAMSNTSLWTNICKTIIFILLGFIFTKKKLLPETTGKVLTKFVMVICLPCLAFCSFMTDYTATGGIDAIFNFVFGFIVYILFMVLGRLMFCWVKDKKKRIVLAVLFAFGSTTFFGYPIVSSVFGKTAGNNFNLMNVAYRVFLYSYAYVAIKDLQDDKTPAASLAVETNSGVSENIDNNNQATEQHEKQVKKSFFEKYEIGPLMKKVFVNPIVIATFAGLFLWFLQAIPGASSMVNKNLYTPWDSEITDTVAFWRIDVTLPWLYNSANTLGGLSSTIILFAIGCTLGGTNIKEAVEDKYAWIWTALKVFVAPAIVLCLLLGIQGIANVAGWSKTITYTLTIGKKTTDVQFTHNVSQLISMDTVSSSIIHWMVPPATVAVGYCISFDKEKEMASHISLVGTLGAVFGIVFWVIIITAIESTGFFGQGKNDPAFILASTNAAETNDFVSILKSFFLM